MKSISFLIFAIVLLPVFADESAMSFRGVFKDEDNGQTHLNVHRYASISYDQLEKYWDLLGKVERKDSNNQLWKTISIEQMEKLVGDIPEQYLLINPIMKVVNANQRDEHYVVVDYELERRDVTGAALFRWGCDESLSTVVQIGKWPSKSLFEEGPMAIPYRTDMGNVIITDLDKSLVPEEILQKAKKPLQGFSLLGIESGFMASVITVSEPLAKYVKSRDYLVIKENDKVKIIAFERAFPVC